LKLSFFSRVDGATRFEFDITVKKESKQSMHETSLSFSRRLRSKRMEIERDSHESCRGERVTQRDGDEIASP
jgi:hypothetical protein